MVLVEQKSTGPEILSPSGFEMQTNACFLKDFANRTRTANTRILIQSMQFDPDHFGCLFAHLLKQASLRGVSVSVVIDDYYNAVTSQFPKMALGLAGRDEKKYHQLMIRAKEEEFESLKAAGVNVRVKSDTELGKIIPLVLRDHRKIFVVDSTVWLGGLNVSASSFSLFDLVVKVEENLPLVSVVESEFGSDRDGRNKKYNCGNVDVLIDGGGSDSIILEEANIMVRGAKRRICYISTFSPSGNLGKAIFSASREGVLVSVVTPDTQNTLGMCGNALSGVTKGRNNIGFVKLRGQTHAKVLVVDDCVLIGSHNLISLSTQIGTREMDFVINDSSVADSIFSLVSNIKKRKGEWVDFNS